jgi:hypothetical protein
MTTKKKALKRIKKFIQSNTIIMKDGMRKITKTVRRRTTTRFPPRSDLKSKSPTPLPTKNSHLDSPKNLRPTIWNPGSSQPPDHSFQIGGHRDGATHPRLIIDTLLYSPTFLGPTLALRLPLRFQLALDF